LSAEYLSPNDLIDLQYAKQLLENPGFAARVANALGSPIGKGLACLPHGATEIITGATNKSLEVALHFAILTITKGQQESSNWLHKMMIAASGMAGGALGLPGLAIELPISTTIMLRSIADVARSEGEDVTSVETKLACLEVFALGGRTNSDDASKSGYFAVRAALAKAFSEAAEYLAERSIVQETAPPLVRFITQIGVRFGIQVSEKAMAQIVPIIGGIGGALVNTMFIDHFQDMARGHFIVRRLERKCGNEAVKAAYEELPSKEP